MTRKEARSELYYETTSLWCDDRSDEPVVLGLRELLITERMARRQAEAERAEIERSYKLIHEEWEAADDKVAQLEADLERTQHELDAADIACEGWRAKYEDARREVERLKDEAVSRTVILAIPGSIEGTRKIRTEALEEAAVEVNELTAPMMNYYPDLISRTEAESTIRALKEKP